jgi:hypothetical protein
MELKVFFTIIQQTYSKLVISFMNRKSSCGYATHFFQMSRFSDRGFLKIYETWLSFNGQQQMIELLHDKNCYDINPDKSNAVVIMDKDKYNDNMQQLIDDGPYELMTSNPIPRLIEKAKKLSEEIIEKMNLSSFWK